MRVFLSLLPADRFAGAGDGWVLYFSGLFGYPLLHEDWGHLLRNILGVGFAGIFVERRFVAGGLGRAQYLAFAWACGVLAGVAISIWCSLRGETVLAMGMSAVGFGLAGAVLVVGARPPVWVLSCLMFLVILQCDEWVGVIVFRDSIDVPLFAHSTAFFLGVLLGMAAERKWLRPESELGEGRVRALDRMRACLGYVLPIAAVVSLIPKLPASRFVVAHAIRSVAGWGVFSAYFVAMAVVLKTSYGPGYDASLAVRWLLAYPAMAFISVVVSLAVSALRLAPPERFYAQSGAKTKAESSPSRPTA